MKKALGTLVLLVAVIFTPVAALCAVSPKLSSTTLNMKVGTKQQLFITNVTTSITLKWKSSNTSVVSVKDGLLTAKKAGTAKITATVNKRNLKCTVKVTKKETEYQIGDTWKVNNEWSVKINSVEETQDRNQFSEKTPKAVYIVTYTYKNLGYDREDWDGLYLNIDDRIVDAKGYMGYSYPATRAYFPQEVPIGASCKAQVCVGVDHPGNFKLYVEEYDSNETEQKAIFNVKVK